MPGDAKLETADELVELYSNPEKLKAYKYTQPIVSTKGINNEKFHMELPYQEIKSIVEKCGEDLFAAIPPEERAGLRWEHVGSTSIEGMPGAMMPDALLILPSFPPSKAVVQVSIWNSEASLPLCSFLGSPGLWLLLQQLQPPGPSRPLVVPGLHLRPPRRPQVDRARLHRGLHRRQDPAGLQGHVQERGVGLRGLQAGQGGGRQGQLGGVQVREGQQQQAAHYAQGKAWHGEIRPILTSLCSEDAFW